jgi:hypothetical protein
MAGLSRTSMQIASVFPKSVTKVRPSSTFGFCMDTRSAVVAKVFDPRCHVECVGPHKESFQVQRQACHLQADDRRSRHARLYSLTSKHRVLAAANFELIAIRVFKKDGVVTRTVAFWNFGAFELLSASFAHELCDPIHLLPRISPKRDACAIRFVVFVWTEAKEFRRFVAATGIKSMKVSPGFLVNEPKLGQKFSVKFYRRFHVFDTQINMIEATRFHLRILNRIASQFNQSRS